MPPADQMMNIRNEMMQTMIDCGLDVEAQHHEVATAGQSEIDLRFDELVRMADKMMIYKYIIKNVATKYNKTVTFMPKRCLATTGRACIPTSLCGREARPCLPGRAMPA